MKKLIFIFALSLIIIFIRCNKETTIQPLKNFDIENDTNIVDTSEIEYINELSGTISTQGVSCINGTLVFETKDDFDRIMAEIVNHSRDDILVWENTLGFTSRYTFWNNYENNNENIDDLDNQINRLADPYFESVINRYNKLRIGDTMYIYDFSNRYLKKKTQNGDSMMVYLGDGSFFIPEYSTECGICKTWAPDKYYNNNTELLRAYKWISNFSIYNSIGIGEIYFEVKPNGKKKRKPVSELNLFIDQWHFVEWTYYGGALWDQISDTARKTTNKDHNQWVLHWNPNPGMKYCVTKFERFHCFTTNFFNDLHHDAECH